MSDILIAGVEYVCQSCRLTHIVYVSPHVDNGVATIDLDGEHRDGELPCPDCDTTRYHVAAKVEHAPDPTVESETDTEAVND